MIATTQHVLAHSGDMNDDGFCYTAVLACAEIDHKKHFMVSTNVVNMR